MSRDADRLREIRDFYSLGPLLGTSGQPSEEQFQYIRQAGFQVIINLAVPTSDLAIPNEGSIVSSLGMCYVHIPVEFSAPTLENFNAFAGVMDAFDGRPIFVHCAANKRVSAFLFLYRVLYKGLAREQAEADLLALWQPNAVWKAFMEDQLAAPRVTGQDKKP